MRNKPLHILIFILSTAFSNASAQSYVRPLPSDTIRNKIDSIIQSKHRADSVNIYAVLEDSNMPEGWFSHLRFDSAKGILFWGNSYIYKGRNKYLTNYYFFNDKLIGTQTSKMSIKHQDSDKYNKWERNCTYWNDSLIYSFTTDNEPFDYKQELITAAEIIKRFKFLYLNKKLVFQKESNIGHFR